MIGFEALPPRSTWLPSAKIVDVTLRDGGFRTQFTWSQSEIEVVARCAAQSGAEFVELGYVGGVPELHHVDALGITAALRPRDIESLKAAVPTAKLAAMIHPSALRQPPDLQSYRTAGLEMVRFVYHPAWLDTLPPLIDAARRAGLLTSLNLALASRYTRQEFETEVRKARQLASDIIYIADTCAGLAPKDTAAMVAFARSTGSAVGFHAHDFLSLAFANSIAAAEAGAEFIDASILGVGRGAGNLRTELWLAVQASQGSAGARVGPLVEAIEAIESLLGKQKIADLASIAAGALNLAPPQEDLLREKGLCHFGSWTTAAAVLLDNAEGGNAIEQIFAVAQEAGPRAQ